MIRFALSHAAKTSKHSTQFGAGDPFLAYEPACQKGIAEAEGARRELRVGAAAALKNDRGAVGIELRVAQRDVAEIHCGGPEHMPSTRYYSAHSRFARATNAGGQPLVLGKRF
jgi:hypothetical protein